MINFTVGPVQSEDYVLQIGAKHSPYFRTPEFSEVMLESERLMLKFANAPVGSKVCFITGSGTASMEAAVMNCFDRNDRVFIVNGGSFGERFVKICKLHGIEYTEIKKQPGRTLTEDDLNSLDTKGYTGFLVNIHETSTGVYYDPELISRFCKKHNLFLVVDAISSFLADDFNMRDWGVNVMITGSQKALAVPPGVSVIVLDGKAQERIAANECKCMYLDIKAALKDAERGQTPFTPAVTTLLQINERLKRIDEKGVRFETERIKNLANDFRNSIKDLPVCIFSDNMSNAVTPLAVREGRDAYEVFSVLKDEYGIWICPNGGDLRHQVFRVGHIGALTKSDNKVLVSALFELKKRGII